MQTENFDRHGDLFVRLICGSFRHQLLHWTGDGWEASILNMLKIQVFCFIPASVLHLDSHVPSVSCMGTQKAITCWVRLLAQPAYLWTDGKTEKIVQPVPEGRSLLCYEWQQGFRKEPFPALPGERWRFNLDPCACKAHVVSQLWSLHGTACLPR